MSNRVRYDIPEGLAIPEWNEPGKKVALEIPDYKYENHALDTLSYYEEPLSKRQTSLHGEILQFE